MPDTPPTPPPDPSAPSQTKHIAKPYDLLQPQIHAVAKRYWRTNVCIMLVLLAVWAAVGLGCGVLWADTLNGLTFQGKPLRFGGIPLGFWFAQQGSIIVFVLLILIYAVLLNWLDRRHHREIRQLRIQRAKD